MDCFMRAFRHEGIGGLYRGTLPFLIGIVPQRAFQLTLYSQISKTFEEKDDITGQLVVPLPFQILAGGVAGACKVLFGNPLDIARIELQTLGETARMMKARGRQAPSGSFGEIAKELGAVGYYRGASSTLWRDIPFSATFFPCYTATKLFLPTIEGYQSDEFRDAFFAAALAAIPAALVTTPADVIKTRLQSAHREGDITYTGVRQCALKIYKHEGAGAFFKGAWLRALRAGPQMGLTMAAYEKLSDMWGVNNNKRRMDSRGLSSDSSDYRRAYPMRGYGSKTEDIDGLMQHMGMSAPESAEDENGKK
jgi:solute carrier family 25 aspartate/glutamate transporter 12/13